MVIIQIITLVGCWTALLFIFVIDLTCCLHHESKGKSVGSINAFSEATLATCKRILKTRKDKGLKYSEVELPEVLPSNMGYHRKCYQRFGALGTLHRKKEDKVKKIRADKRKTRSQVMSPVDTSTGMFKKICLFCKKARRKKGGQEQRLTRVETKEDSDGEVEKSKKATSDDASFKTSVEKYAKWLQDEDMLRIISGVDLVAKEVYYHRSCRRDYQNKAECTEAAKVDAGIGKDPKVHSEWHVNRQAHSQAFEVVKRFVESSVCKMGGVVYLPDMKNLYEAAYKDLCEKQDDGLEFSASRLEAKLVTALGDRICVVKGTTRQGNLIYGSTDTAEAALRKQHSESYCKERKLRDVAFMLRSEILGSESTGLPENITMDTIKSGTVTTPPLVEKFLQYLIAGPDIRLWKSNTKKRRINSLGADLVFAASNGRKIPSKQLKVGLSFKSITGSRQVIDMLNHMNQSVSYSVVEELETELTYNVTKDNSVTPPGLSKSSDTGIGLAFDNYDRFMDTPSGKDTLHDTVGIGYQLVSTESGSITASSPSTLETDGVQQPSQESLVANSNIVEAEKSSEGVTVEETRPTRGASAKNRKRRRTFEPTGLDIPSYRKKPRIKLKILPLDHPKRRLYEVITADEAEAWKKDIMWMADIVTDKDETTPMFVGWNAMLLPKEDQRQKVVYLPQINQSPTSYAVVKETMDRALCVAEECGKESVVVTYDLAIAKMALQIQEEEEPTYDRIFIALGIFHLELAMFRAIGTYIAESGGPYVLNECFVLAKGSTKSFQKGKSYKRCRKLHELLALAMESLHFQAFIDSNENGSDNIELIKDELKIIKEQKDIENHVFSKEVEEFLELYKKFTVDTSKGLHGKTAQYWMIYIEMVHMYHQLTRSVRTGNINLYTACLPKITNYFFALNQPNYARWTVKYHDNLLKLPETHPEVYKEFQNHLFGIKRTNKPFSRIPIDLTLEQTINGDAANQRTGISSITNSIGARQRWANSHFIRVSIVSQLLDELGLSKKDDVTSDLKKHSIRKSWAGLKKLKDMIADTLNPFNSQVDPNFLYNIGTGKAAKDSTAAFLLNCVAIGERERKQFIDECSKDPQRFEKPIKRQKLETFATESGKHKIKGKDGKTIAACYMRDLFGSILSLSLEKKIDIFEVLSFPLTPVPLSLGI